MKHKAKVHRSRDLPPPPAISETGVGLSGGPATPGRSSIERVDEHETGSIESVRPTGPENGVAGFIEPERPDAQGVR